MASFANFSEAEAAGYRRRKQVVELVNGFRLVSIDVSDSRCRGYDFALVAQPPWEVEVIRSSPDLARSVSVLLTEELNAIQQPGCFAPMWAPGDLDRAIEAGSAWVAGQRTQHADLLDAYERKVATQLRRDKLKRQARHARNQGGGAVPDLEAALAEARMVAAAALADYIQCWGRTRMHA